MKHVQDISALPPLELLAAITVASGGGFYVGLQKAYAPGCHSLVLFNAHFGATLAISIDELSTQAVKDKLAKAAADFGIEVPGQG